MNEADIAAIRDALPRRKDDGQGGAYLHHDTDAWASACNPERIARLLDALEKARREVAAWRMRHPAQTYRMQDDCISLKLTPP